MILVLDNYDSFTYNLVQRMGEIDPTVEIKVVRNDKLTIDEVRQLAPARILISPGPCSPCDAGISVDIVKELALPPVKIHCSVLAEDAIRAAVSDLKSKKTSGVQA